MKTHTVAVVDKFHQPSLDTIARCLPKEWKLKISNSTDLADMQSVIHDADVLFVMGVKIDDQFIKAAPKLRFIQKLGAGVDHIDLLTCQDHGITVARLGGGNAVPVAEHTLLLTLAALRHLPKLDLETRAGEWVRERARTVSRQLSQKIVGIIGFGAIGKAYAQLLKGFDVRVQYFDIVKANAATCGFLNASYVEFEDLLRSSDVISLHVPLNAETRHMIGKSELKLMRKEAVLINCARGGIVDESALIEALQSESIHAAGLDVFSTEPPGINSPLFKLKNIVVSPHTAGGTVDNFEKIVLRAIENVCTLDSGLSLPANDIACSPKSNHWK